MVRKNKSCEIEIIENLRDLVLAIISDLKLSNFDIYFGQTFPFSGITKRSRFEHGIFCEAKGITVVYPLLC